MKFVLKLVFIVDVFEFGSDVENEDFEVSESQKLSGFVGSQGTVFSDPCRRQIGFENELGESSRKRSKFSGDLCVVVGFCLCRLNRLICV